MEKPQAEEQRVETSTQEGISREGRKRNKEAGTLLQDVRENVEVPTSHLRQRRSPNQYTGYMDVISELVETQPSSFEEVVEKPVWVNAMVEEYDFIVRNNVWEVVPRPIEK